MNCLICHSPILSPWAKTCQGKCRRRREADRVNRFHAAKRLPRYCECGVQIYWRQERCKACAKERVKAQWRAHSKARRELEKKDNAMFGIKWRAA